MNRRVGYLRRRRREEEKKSFGPAGRAPRTLAYAEAAEHGSRKGRVESNLQERMEHSLAELQDAVLSTEEPRRDR